MKKILLLFSALTSGLSFGQISIGSGTAVDSNPGLSTPISIHYSTSLSQSIYLASEIGTSGTITSIDFKVNQTGSLANSNAMLDVWIGHTNKAAYNPTVGTSGADWVNIATHTQVLANGSFTQTGTVLTCTFTTPFVYNGTDNLVITVDANQSGNNGSAIKFLQTAATTDTMCLMIRTDTAADNANPLSPPMNYSGTTTATSVQAKKTRPQIVLYGSFLGTEDFTVNTVALYPNPVINELSIQSLYKVTTAEIYNLTGQRVKTLKANNNSVAADGLASGVYIVKLNLENGATVSKKFTKQ